jgi:E3 ubiquitin-protein ligase RFWD3
VIEVEQSCTRIETTVEENSECANLKRPATEVQDHDERAECPICFEPWSSTGPHRICCLVCGHLFGHNCIMKWLKNQ